MYGHEYTQEERAFIERYVPGHSYADIQKAFNEKFGWEISIGQIKSYIGNHHLNTGRTGCFEKGHIPMNKGKKMPEEVYEKVKRTMFKKGNMPKQYRPVGSERVDKDGYIVVKIKDPDVWVPKHRHIWESKHGSIPSGHIVIFKDGNNRNFDIDNLLMISRAENLIMNHTGLNSCDAELKETAVNIAKLKIKTSKAKKGLRRKGIE